MGNYIPWWLILLLQSCFLAQKLRCCRSVNAKSWWLKVYLRWVFRKNSMEFSIEFDYLLILFYKWLCSTITWSHVLPEHSMITWLYHVIWLPDFPMLFISCLHYTIWYWRSNVQTCGKLFPFWGSHNMAPPSRFLILRNFSIVSNSCPTFSLSPFCTFFSPNHIVILHKLPWQFLAKFFLFFF